MPMHGPVRLPAKNFDAHARRIGNEGRHKIAADQPNVVLTDASHPKPRSNASSIIECPKFGKEARRFIGASRHSPAWEAGGYCPRFRSVLLRMIAQPVRRD